MPRRKIAAKAAAALERLRPEEAATVLNHLLNQHPELGSAAEELATALNWPRRFGVARRR